MILCCTGLLCGEPGLHLFAHLELHPGILDTGFHGLEIHLIDSGFGKRDWGSTPSAAGRIKAMGIGLWDTAGGGDELSLKGRTGDSCQIWGPESSDKQRTHAVYNLTLSRLDYTLKALAPGSNYPGPHLPRRKTACDSPRLTSLSPDSHPLSDMNRKECRWWRGPWLLTHTLQNLVTVSCVTTTLSLIISNLIPLHRLSW